MTTQHLYCARSPSVLQVACSTNFFRRNAQIPPRNVFDRLSTLQINTNALQLLQAHSALSAFSRHLYCVYSYARRCFQARIPSYIIICSIFCIVLILGLLNRHPPPSLSNDTTLSLFIFIPSSSSFTVWFNPTDLSPFSSSNSSYK